MSILGYDWDVVDHIVRFADSNGLPPICLLALGLQESNLNPQAVGDVGIGGSYGVYQIYVSAHGGPPERWTGLAGLDTSMVEMQERWSRTFAQHGGWDAVTADLVAFQQAWSPDAQGSIPWTESMARKQVSKAVAVYALYLRGQTDSFPALRNAVDALTLAAQGLDDLSARATLQAWGARKAAAALGS